MPDDVEGTGKATEDDTVAISLSHLFTVPEGVVEATARVHRGEQAHAIIVQRVAVEEFLVEVIRVSGEGVSFVDGDVFVFGIAF